jgi:hypothetical protein
VTKSQLIINYRDRDRDRDLDYRDRNYRGCDVTKSQPIINYSDRDHRDRDRVLCVLCVLCVGGSFSAVSALVEGTATAALPPRLFADAYNTNSLDNLLPCSHLSIVIASDFNARSLRELYGHVISQRNVLNFRIP